MGRGSLGVLFFHSGLEREVGKDELKQGYCDWRKATFSKKKGKLIYPSHHRVCLATDGEFISTLGSNSQKGSILFWNEYEAQTFVIRNTLYQSLTRNNTETNRLPKYIHIPILPRNTPRGHCLNTDPCVIDGKFLYALCQQYTNGEPNYLQELEAGEVIIFGSAFGYGEDKLKNKSFAVDTVFVIAKKYKYNSRSAISTIGDAVPSWYYNLTIDLVRGDRNFTLYEGATNDKPYNGMFSFFPCIDIKSTPQGFVRPIVLNKYCNGKTQGTWAIKDTDAKSLWQQVVQDILVQDLFIGVKANVDNNVLEILSAIHHRSNGLTL